MSYEPTVWKDGDVVTSARLNKIEEGIETLANNPVSSFDLSDRIAKGVDDNGNVVNGAIVEGDLHYNRASDVYAHAMGIRTVASGAGSFAMGGSTTASGMASHAEGIGTIANHQSQHAFGEYNIEDPSTNRINQRGTYIEIVGNGDTETRSNARTLDWQGNERLAGSLTLGDGTNDVVTITAAQLKQLLTMLS